MLLMNLAAAAVTTLPPTQNWQLKSPYDYVKAGECAIWWNKCAEGSLLVGSFFSSY
jgi:hypothetical protein